MIKAEEICFVEIKELRPNPKNRNKHPRDQIERLMKLIEYQGFRNPVIVSKQSGFIVAGHGRALAAQRLGLTEVPVIYQDFDSDDQEFAYQVSDNSIASWAELDLSGINEDLVNMGPFDIDLLGIKSFTVDPSEIDPPKESKVDTLEFKSITCPHCEETFELKKGR